MKTKAILVTALIIAVGLAVAAWMIFNSSALQQTVQADTKRVDAPTQTPATSSPVEEPAKIGEGMPKPTVQQEAVPKVEPQSKPAKKPKEPLHDPDARVALSLVGADPDAEAYWLEAIYDSSLPDKEREDLMEDLNEEGLSDTKHPGPQDLPLILNRLAIIEEVAPNADDFMLPHLREAYKDLVNLAKITQGGGEPVR